MGEDQGERAARRDSAAAGPGSRRVVCARPSGRGTGIRRRAAAASLSVFRAPAPPFGLAASRCFPNGWYGALPVFRPKRDNTSPLTGELITDRLPQAIKKHREGIVR